MTSLRRWDMSDLWTFNRINIDDWTETFSTRFYLYYTTENKELNWTARNNSGETVGYIFGSGQENRVGDMISHVAAVTVASDSRRLGIASKLMEIFETVSDGLLKAKCVGLYVRPTNDNAINMYKKLGYKIYRTITNYYDHVNEDGLDMRKSLSLDPEKIYEQELSKPCSVDDLSDEE